MTEKKPNGNKYTNIQNNDKYKIPDRSDIRQIFGVNNIVSILERYNRQLEKQGKRKIVFPNREELKFKDNFFKLLTEAQEGMTSESKKKLNNKIFQIIIRSIISQSKVSSSGFTSIFSKKFQIKKILEIEDIKNYFKKALPLKDKELRSITSMFCKKAELPNIDELRYFLLKIEELQKKYPEMNLSLKSISGMQHSFGIPDLNKLEEFVKKCNELNIDIKSITGMQNGRGIPDLDKLEEFVNKCNELKIDIKSISGMQNGRGIPDLDKLEEFVDKCDELQKEYPEMNLSLKSITGIQHSFGIPDLNKLEEFVNKCNELKINIKSITGMQHTFGIPDLNKLEEFVKKCNKLNIDLKSITGMQNGCGIPDSKKLEEFVNKCNELNIDIKSITGMQNGLGIPDLNRLEEFVKKCNELNIDIKSITGMQTGCGIPDSNRLEEFVKKLREFCEIQDLQFNNVLIKITSQQIGIPNINPENHKDFKEYLNSI